MSLPTPSQSVSHKQFHQCVKIDRLDIYFTDASWFSWNLRVQPHCNTQWRGGGACHPDPQPYFQRSCYSTTCLRSCSATAEKAAASFVRVSKGLANSICYSYLVASSRSLRLTGPAEQGVPVRYSLNVKLFFHNACMYKVWASAVLA